MLEAEPIGELEIFTKENEKIVTIKALHKDYIIDDQPIQILKDINLEVQQGEFICIHGPSGVGKTTLLNLIGALDRPTGGKIIVFQHDLEEYNEDSLATFRSAYIGFIFQSYNLISTLSAFENIGFVMELAGSPKKRIAKYSKELLKMVGLEHRANHFPSQLSGGERQRVAIARALANNPLLILADEPTGNLDTETSNRIVNILKTINYEGKTVIAATHDKELLKLADRTFCLRDGRLTR